MRILFSIDSLAAGGKERRLVELIKGLKTQSEIALELIILSQDIHYEEVLSLEIYINRIKRKSKKDLRVFYEFYKICKRFKPDLLHCWDSMTAVYAFPICKLLNIPLVNGMVVDTPVKRNILNKSWLRAKITFPFSSVIVGNSKAGLSAYGAPMDKSVCIYNGIDLTRLDKLVEPSLMRRQIFGHDADDLFIIGMVAAFEERKDYKTLIKAAIHLVSTNNALRFVLVGDGVDFIKIRKSVPQTLSNKIIFLGKRSDVESITHTFNVGVLLTNTRVHGEGISNSIIEYMALGKTVIATRGGGTSEVVIDDKTGYLIDADDHKQLIQKIESLVNDQSYMEILGRNGKQMIHDRFDLKLMTSQFITIYHQVVKQNAKII